MPGLFLLNFVAIIHGGQKRLQCLWEAKKSSFNLDATDPGSLVSAGEERLSQQAPISQARPCLSFFPLILRPGLCWGWSLISQLKRAACNKSVCSIYKSIKGRQKGQAGSTWVWEPVRCLQLSRWLGNAHETKYLNPEKDPLYVSLEIKQFCMTKNN